MGDFMDNSGNMLSVLAQLMPAGTDEIAMKIAGDFKRRRIEKNLSRKQIAEKSGVALSNITRFERTGLVSLKNLIDLAVTLGYAMEIESLFSSPKYSTMEELLTIRNNSGRKKASGR